MWFVQRTKIKEIYIISSNIHMDVSENNGTPKSSILMGFSIINHPFGVPLFLEIPIYCQTMLRMLDHHISTSWDQRLIKLQAKQMLANKNHLSGTTCNPTLLENMVLVLGWNGHTAGYILYLRGHLHRLPMACPPSELSRPYASGRRRAHSNPCGWNEKTHPGDITWKYCFVDEAA